MIKIDEIKYKDKIAIVVIGYNKLLGLKRLLNTLCKAYYEVNDVPLVISIDASNNEELYEYVRNFKWEYGEKILNIQDVRLGLKNHIFQCASLTKYFRGVIILEDDIFVSPYFYHYSIEVLNKYGNDEHVAGISLYNNERNGFVSFPLQILSSGFDVYAAQSVCSWGEIWNKRMWNDFIVWLERWNDDFSSIDMPLVIKKWERAWSKYYYAYMISMNKYFIYPYISVSTNFNDVGGEHGGGDTSLVQVSLLQGIRKYQLGNFEDLVCYDVYYQNLDIPLWLGVKVEDIVVDFYGMKEKYDKKYILTPFLLPYKKVRGFSLCLRPWELNVKYNIEGNDFFLYEKASMEYIPPKRVFTYNVHAYYLRSYKTIFLLKYSFGYYWKRMKYKLKRICHGFNFYMW